MAHEIAETSRLGNRSQDQDRFCAVTSAQGVLLVLADGMGGFPRGEAAAEFLIETARQAYAGATRPIADPERFFSKVLRETHERIVSFGCSQEPPITPATTAVLCLIQGSHAYWAHVGDSRLYVVRNGTSLYRTQDHASGFRQPGTAMRRRTMTRCIGGKMASAPKAPLGSARLCGGDVVLLCSDGLWTPLHEADIGAALMGEPLASGLQGLAERAERASYPHADNISAIALRFEEGAHTPQPGPARKTGERRRNEGDELQRAIADIERVLEEYEQEMKG